MRLIDSTPPAITRSAWPLAMAWAAKWTACWPEQHIRPHFLQRAIPAPDWRADGLHDHHVVELTGHRYAPPRRRRRHEPRRRAREGYREDRSAGVLLLVGPYRPDDPRAP